MRVEGRGVVSAVRSDAVVTSRALGMRSSTVGPWNARSPASRSSQMWSTVMSE